MGFPGGSVVKNLPGNAGDAGLILGSGRALGVGNDNPFQSACLENPTDRGVLWAVVHGVAIKSHMTQQLNKNNKNKCNNKKKEKQMNSFSKNKSGECQETKAKAVDTLSS